MPPTINVLFVGGPPPSDNERHSSGSVDTGTRFRFTCIPSIDAASAHLAESGILPDVVVLHVCWPPVVLRAYVSELKRLAAGIPLVILVASDASDTTMQGLQAGADDFIEKSEWDAARFFRLQVAVEKYRENKRVVSGYPLMTELPQLLVGTQSGVDSVRNYPGPLGEKHGVIFRINPDGLLGYASPAASILTGFSFEELLGEPIFNLFFELEETPSHEVGGDAVSILGQIRCKNRAAVWVKGSVTIVRDDSDEIFEMIAVLQELDTRYEAEKRLRESERRFLYLFECNVLAMCTWSHGFWVTDANEAYLQLTGLLESEISGGEICLHDGAFGLGQRAIDEMNQRGVCTPFEKEFVRKDGTRYSVLLGAARMDEDGETGVLFALDITDRKKTEQIHSRLAAIVDSSDDAILSVTLGGIVQSWNSSATRMYGYSREEMIGQSLTKIETEGNRGETLRVIREVSEGERVARFETIRSRKNGEVLHVSVTMSPIVAPDGHVVGASSIARDITETKITEAFREGQTQLWHMVGQKQRLPDVLESLAKLLCRLSPGAAACVLLVSDNGLTLHRGGAAGVSDALMELIDCTPIRDEGPPCARAAFSRKAVLVADLKTDDGWGELTGAAIKEKFQASYSFPIIALSGLALGTIEIFFTQERVPTPVEYRLIEQSADLARGILEQHAADVDAAKAREQSRLILDTLDEVAFTYQPAKNRFLYLSAVAEKTFGISTAEIEAKPQLLAGLDSLSVDRLIELLVERLQGRRAGIIEYRITTPKGETKWLACRVQLSAFANGDVTAIHGIIHDVTSLKALEAELQAKSKMAVVGLLAAGVAHEIGNPLAFLSARLQRLGSSSAPALTLESISQMKSQVDRITTTLRKISGFTRSEATTWTPCNVHELVQETIEILKLSGRSAQIEIISEIDPQLPIVSLVKEQLHQVFINLGLNAFDAMPQGGQLVIKARLGNGDLSVSFTDTGIGIPQDIQNRIFEPGFSTKGGGRNMGLGLYLSLTFVKAHGGTISCQSVEGRGATFAVHLPILNS